MSVSADLSSEILDITADLEIVLRGEDGKSAYEVAVDNGFVGTEQEWLDSLKGEADRAEQYTQEAKEYRNAAQSNAILAGNQANAARIFRDETQAIRDGFAPEVANAMAAIQAEKEEAEQKKLLVDEAAENANLDRVQADADAAEVRYLYNETVTQKNVATDAAERARRYTYDALNWLNISNKPTTRDGYGITDVPKVDGTDATGTWDIDITGDAATVNGLTVEKAVPPDAVFTDTTYDTMTQSEVETGTDITGKLITPKLFADVIASAIANLVNSSPSALDTLKELADALGNDPNFATTVMNAIGQKLDKAGGTVTGDLTVNGTFTADVTGNADTATKLATARTINIQDSTATNTGTGASFDGSGNATIKLPATINANLTGDVTGNVSGSSGSCTGNAATATKLQTSRTLWGQSFDGSGNVSGDMTGVGTITASGSVTGKTINVIAENTDSEGGQVNLLASKNTYNGIIIDNFQGMLRVFGIPSADGTTKTGPGTHLNVDPYAKTITGGYTLTGNVTGNAGTATKINGKTIPVVSSFNSTTGVLALTSLS